MEHIKINGIKWAEMDMNSASAAYQMAQSKGILIPFSTGQIPQSIQHGSNRSGPMAGVNDYQLSGYFDPISISDGLIAEGEMMVGRIDNGIYKTYMWVIGTDGKKYYYHGPLKLRSFHYQEPDTVDTLLGFGHFYRRLRDPSD